MKKLKIIFANRKDCFDKPGGDTVQMLKTKKYLEKYYPVKIEILLKPEEILSDKEAKIVHIFNLQTINETNEFINAARIGNKKVVCLNSATAAMEMTLRVLGIGKGDEVIVPAYTYTATCSVICHVGATPVIVDTAKGSFEMDYDQLDSVITDKTKAIMPVDIAGIICDYDKVAMCIERNKSKFCPKNEIQKNFGRIIVIADSAHGFGAVKNSRLSGKFADFTCFSFHAVKNLTTAEGGAVTWQRREFIDDEILEAVGGKRHRTVGIPGKAYLAAAFWCIDGQKFYVQMVHARNFGHE